MGGASGLIRTLGARFLFSKNADGFLSLISWVSVVGVSLGVVALVVVTSVINGFEGELVRVITGMNGDVVLYSRGEPITEPDAIERRIRSTVPETEAVTSSFVSELMASGPSGVAGAVLEGVDFDTVGAVTSLKSRVVAGRLPETKDEVALGSAIADRIGATAVGSEIRLVIPFVQESEPSRSSDVGAPRVIPVRVVGVVKMGMYEYDSKFVFAALPFVQEALGRAGQVTSFKIRLANGTDSRKASDRLSETFGFPFRAKDWGQLNKNLFYAIQLEKVVISIILTVIVIVAAFNVVSTLMMMIHDKTREIAILKAMGFPPRQAFLLFVGMGSAIGGLGTVVGVVIGSALNFVLARTHLIELPPDVYYLSFLPVRTRWSEVLLIAVVTLLITVVATLYPAFTVSRRSPMEGIRDER